MDFSAAQQRVAGPGFIAALDQSGGSTPKALMAYGIQDGSWKSEEEMFEMMHEMRKRIIVNSAFDSRIMGTILFERTMKGDIDGMPTAQYLWEKKNIVPFLKIDKGLLEEADHVQLMKPISGIDDTLKSAVEYGIFGTKERSVINDADEKGIAAVAAQQFEVAATVIKHGLMPILEPEISIKAPNKKAAEQMLRDELMKGLDALPENQKVMLKLTLPEEPDFYMPLIKHPRVLRVVALSGGYSMDDANKKLAQNHGMTASFSRALVEDLRVDQSDEEFTAKLNAAIQGIYDASIS